MAVDRRYFTIPADTPVSKLDAKEAFEGLGEKERLYAHYLCRASWEAAPICLLQTSPESAPVFLLLQRVFSAQSISSLRETASSQCGLNDQQFNAFLVYAAGFLNNLGNYRSFGDTKIVPGIAKDDLHKLITASESYKQDGRLIDELWAAVSGRLYSLNDGDRQLGFPPQGITTYYSQNFTREDASLIQGFMLEKSLEPYNTRAFKTVKDGQTKYELRLASSVTSSESCGPEDEMAAMLGAHTYKGASITLTRGDYAPLMKRMEDNLRKAKEYAANSFEVAMLEDYARSFKTGSLNAHKDGSRQWIKNKGPVVETYIGFIESYRDPFGVRGEYEGFVAVVNKAMSAKFGKLVSSAEDLLCRLPWPKEFEKDHFLRPDFTSLDVLAFGSSGIPAGINIPNYDEIRQDEGFKNVSLGNVLSAAAGDKRVSFVPPEVQDVYVQLRAASFEVQVGLHELLGHGSGKMFKQDDKGQFNFDKDKVINPLTGGKIASWYGPSETYDTRFSSVASSYEECRAECVGIYLCCDREILSIFGHEGSAADDIIFVNWLNMVRAGLVGLEYFTPETKKWGQAHMQARYVILRVLLECENLVSIEQITNSEDGKPDLLVHLERTRIESVGKPAIGKFLNKLQVYRSTANVSAGETLYTDYSSVTEDHLALRNIVLARKMPRRMFVQPHTCIGSDGKVELKDFETTPEGIITSYLAQFPGYHHDLESLWSKDRCHWN